MESKRRLTRYRRTTRFAWIIPVVVGALLIAACGSEGEPDGAPAAQPTAGTDTAAPTPNPTSVNETVYAPDFELPRAGGGTVRLSDVYADANTVVVFYRGFF